MAKKSAKRVKQKVGKKSAAGRKPARKAKRPSRPKATRKPSPKKTRPGARPRKKAARRGAKPAAKTAARPAARSRKAPAKKRAAAAGSRTIATPRLRRAAPSRDFRGRAGFDPEGSEATRGLGPEAGGQSGDTEGLSRSELADSESVEELLEEGQAFEAGIVSGVENAPDEGEVRTRQFPEDDVPREYLDED